MTTARLASLSERALKGRFLDLAISQHRAVAELDSKRANEIYALMEQVSQELKARPGDQRRELIDLLSHPNAWVRFKAAVHTLGIAPVQARAVLEEVSNQTADPLCRAYARGSYDAVVAGTFPQK